MTREEAARILDEVIPPPDHHTVDLDLLRIAQAWAYVKETLTAEPIKHGHWIFTQKETWYAEFQCSECGEGVYNKTKFCSNCGAKMDEVEE